MRVAVLIPAHDESARVGRTVRAVIGLPVVDRVVVVDDGSTAGTAEAGAEAGAEVIRLERNRGKGGALEAGLAALRGEVDVLVLLDADLAESAAEALPLITPVLDGTADMTVGILPRPARSGGFGLVKGVARRGIRLLCGFTPSAPLSGQRALSSAAQRVATPFARGFGVEVALTVRVARAGLRIREIPVAMTHDATGRDVGGFIHRGRQFIDVVRTLAGLGLRRS